jgi:sugar lactone lactonase YvrE
VFDEQGWLYISDSGSSTLDTPIPDGAIFRVSPLGECELFADGLYLPNGLAMHRGESALYVIQTTENNIVRLEIKPDHSLGARSVFAQGIDTVPDGMAFAENGDLYVIAAASDMIYRVTPDGHSSVFGHDPEREGLFAAANCAFGGPERDQLLISNLGGHISRIANVAKGQLLYHQS